MNQKPRVQTGDTTKVDTLETKDVLFESQIRCPDCKNISTLETLGLGGTCMNCGRELAKELF